MKLVRRKRTRKPKFCVYTLSTPCEHKALRGHTCTERRWGLMPDWLNRYLPSPRNRVSERHVRPVKGRRLIYPPLGWDQLTFPFPFVLRK